MLSNIAEKVNAWTLRTMLTPRHSEWKYRKMNPEIFSEFLARQGHHIVKTESCYWYDAQPWFYFYYPYHCLLTPDEEELNKVFGAEHCIGMRFFVPMDSIGKNSYMIVCSDKNYDIASVDAKSARRQTRRGLENFEIRQFSLRELATLGNSLNHDTLSRQNRNPRIWSERKWQPYCRAAEGLDGFEAWGAFTGKKLASFMVTFQMEDHFTILHPNNALVFHVTKLKLASPEVAAVYYGPQSLAAPESLDTFKFRMGFQKRPMKQKIVFNPLLRPFVNRFSAGIVRAVATSMPRSDRWQKLDGTVRFYREAK
jgi:hypothetical protein